MRKEAFKMLGINRELLIDVKGSFENFEALRAYVDERKGKLLSIQGIEGFSIRY